MARLAAPPAADLAKLAKGGVWHHVQEQVVRGDGVGLGVVRTVCGTTREAVALEPDVDAKAVRFQNADVCAHCRAGGSTLNPKTTDDQGDEPETKEDDTMASTAEKKPASKRERTPKPRASTPKKSAETPVEKNDLKAAVARAEKAIASQPKRTSVELQPAEAEKAFKLGKSIAADRWLLKKAVAGKTSAATVAAMVERIEHRVAERNKIRTGS